KKWIAQAQRVSPDAIYQALAIPYDDPIAVFQMLATHFARPVATTEREWKMSVTRIVRVQNRALYQCIQPSRASRDKQLYSLTTFPALSRLLRRFRPTDAPAGMDVAIAVADMERRYNNWPCAAFSRCINELRKIV